MTKTQKATKVSLNDVINGGTPNTSIDTATDVTGFVLNEKGIPVVNEKSNYPLVNQTLNALAKLNTAKKDAELCKTKMMELSVPIYDSVRGKAKSVKFSNAKGRGIIVTYSDSYQLAEGTEGVVRQSLGETQFNENFEVELKISNKEKNQNGLKEILAIFTQAYNGDENLANAKFDELFEINREVVATKGMDARFNTLPENVRKALVQKKASVSVF